ncbi:E3 ubiquitin-protein ligase NRDP1 [Hydra vulgaris]|uniref:E3 ubiquitin-protein ligase NRDP1 n=1 Tax=Hydra vulgaris TaxID=6087 RepID=UPI0001925A2E|nr:E3 ubiquitin-protein ligase NRDP1-like [Hydra vulgaris]XP_047126382.1 E3 ubiquitin-protein ligase NRDP1-like [Hydra vulgaris]XP_047126383.1 E3 ubiquitin-protein ligase NRDP1-like [Hydra vulgaris]
MDNSNQIDLTCPICLDIADDAVETECCGHIFCEKCAKNVNSCPLCNRVPLSFRITLFGRRLIGNLPKKCDNEGCGKDVARSEFNRHKLLCEFLIKKCYIPTCSFESIKKNLMNHLLTSHSDSVIKILEEHYSTSSSNEISNSKSFISTKINSKGRQARLGATGKYYCSGKLDLASKCQCCDGNCGPDNGCNCTSCMALDISTRKLPSGWYVNKEGFPCVKGNSGKFYCGRKMDLESSDGFCGPGDGPNCMSCEIIGFEESVYEEVR